MHRSSEKEFLVFLKNVIQLFHKLGALKSDIPMKDCLIEIFNDFKLDKLQGYSMRKLKDSCETLFKSAVMKGQIIDSKSRSNSKK